uniref:Guided entry of tail-anchored proteins factor 1 n=1 Tax=Cyanistes caeruleus TaxID=156563 RepID=A0A8C0VCE1_CYACU
MRAEIQTMKQELATISMMDEFARYARLERKINKMTDKLKTHVKARTAQLAKIKWVINIVFYILQAALMISLIWKYYSEPVTVLPSKWLAPLERLVAFPTGVAGEEKDNSQTPKHPWINSSCFSDSQSSGFKYLSSSSVCAQFWLLELIVEFCHFYFHPNRALSSSVLNRPWGRFKLENKKNHPKGSFPHRCAMNSYVLTKQLISTSEEFTFYLSQILNLGSSKAFCDLPDLKLQIFSLGSVADGFSCGVPSPHFSSYLCIWCSFPDNPEFFGTTIDLSPHLLYFPFVYKEFCSCWPHEF